MANSVDADNGTIRTFISIGIPRFEAVDRIVGRLASRSNIRSPPLDQIHLTLSFLGNVNVKRMPRLCDNIARTLSDCESFAMTLRGIGAFPNERNPKVVWIGLDRCDDILGTIVDSITKELDQMKLPYDDKTFTPHITIGRVNGKTNIDDIVSENRDTVFGTFTCDRVDIMNSLLSAKGTRHFIVGSARLL